MRRVLVLTVLLLAGCAKSNVPAGNDVGARPPRTVTVGLAENGRTVSLHRGDSIVVRLTSTYWRLRAPSDAVLSGGRATTRAEPGGVPGSGRGTVTARYVATQAGRTTITAGRTSCGEALRCVGGQGSYSVTVVVHG